jgi:threonine/homoserine/homoserine lactone efflux protein
MTLTPADLLKSLVAGYLSGLILSLPFPVGPVNLTVINHALRKGFLSAFLIGLGAVFAETIYAGAMLAGHLVILDLPYVRLVFHLAAIGLIAGMGLRSLRFREGQAEAHDADIATKVESRWHHPRSFILGFVLNISNLMLLVVWATAATILSEHNWVTPARGSRWTCAVGVLAGGATWFFLVAFFVSRAHRRVRPAVLTALVRGCGVVFIVFAVLLAYKLF